MKINKLIFSLIIFLLLIISVGCNSEKKGIATVLANPNSDFVATFNKLDLGNLFDFEFKLPEAGDKCVYLWVESYVDGIKDPDPLINLSYRSSPDEEVKDHIGFAILNLTSEETYVSLYGSGASSRRKVNFGLEEDVLNSLEYAIGNKPVELELGEEKILAVYRETKGNSVKTLNYDDEQVVEKAIEQSDLIYLFKIVIEKE